MLDHTCNAWKACYKNSGIEKAASEAGAEVVSAAEQKFYVDAAAPNAVSMKTAKVLKVIMECDVFINMPILKNHGGATMTSAMKNLMGIVWDRSFMHKNDLPQTIADSVLFRRPDLNIVDAYRIMTSNGPRGATLGDVKLLKYQLLSRDIVAIDAMSAKLIGYKLAQVPYIEKAEALGLGVSDESKMDIKRITA